MELLFENFLSTNTRLATGNFSRFRGRNPP